MYVTFDVMTVVASDVLYLINCIYLFFLLLLDNPAIYTPTSTILITSSTSIITVTIRVFVDGSDPPPSPNNITWYHNDQLIPTNSTPGYVLTLNNTVLEITGQGSSLIGSYTARVMTTRGENSAIVNVTYPGIKEMIIILIKLCLFILI